MCSKKYQSINNKPINDSITYRQVCLWINYVWYKYVCLWLNYVYMGIIYVCLWLKLWLLDSMMIVHHGNHTTIYWHVSLISIPGVPITSIKCIKAMITRRMRDKERNINWQNNRFTSSSFWYHRCCDTHLLSSYSHCCHYLLLIIIISFFLSSNKEKERRKG